MKFILTFLFASLFALNINAQNKEKGAFLKLDTDTIFFGDLKEGQEAIKKIKVTNTGNKPLIITDCKGSCGCTVPTCPSTTILPGKFEFIDVKYDTVGKNGSFNKTVTIKSNAINRVVYMKVTGTVI